MEEIGSISSLGHWKTKFKSSDRRYPFDSAGGFEKRHLLHIHNRTTVRARCGATCSADERRVGSDDLGQDVKDGLDTGQYAQTRERGGVRERTLGTVLS
jgi:hypothetical protein